MEVLETESPEENLVTVTSPSPATQVLKFPPKKMEFFTVRPTRSGMHVQTYQNFRLFERNGAGILFRSEVIN
jgi:hypothetical protein